MSASRGAHSGTIGLQAASVVQVQVQLYRQGAWVKTNSHMFSTTSPKISARDHNCHGSQVYNSIIVNMTVCPQNAKSTKRKKGDSIGGVLRTQGTHFQSET
eukprot:3558215-Amphidinium_carterae.1